MGSSNCMHTSYLKKSYYLDTKFLIAGVALVLGRQIEVDVGGLVRANDHLDQLKVENH